MSYPAWIYPDWVEADDFDGPEDYAAACANAELSYDMAQEANAAEPRVVGIDFSTTSTGIAIYDVNGWSTYTVKSSGKASDSLRTYYGRVRAIAAQALSIIQPMPGDVIVIEAPIVAGRRNKSEVRLHFAWHRFVERLLAWSPDMADPIEVPPSTVKLRGAGSGRADKKAMHAAVVERLGFSPRTADEADAVWIAFVGAEDSGVRIRVKPLPARAAKKGTKK